MTERAWFCPVACEGLGAEQVICIVAFFAVFGRGKIHSKKLLALM